MTRPWPPSRRNWTRTASPAWKRSSSTPSRTSETQESKPKQTPEQILSLAVSGWLLGPAAAKAKTEFALKLWRTRQFLLEYQRSIPGGRERLCRNYEKDGAVAFDELAQIITTLPPTEPEEKVSSDMMEMEAKRPGRDKGITYLLQGAVEYHPGRPYPVLIVLGHSKEKTKVIFDRFKDLAGGTATSWRPRTGAAASAKLTATRPRSRRPFMTCCATCSGAPMWTPIASSWPATARAASWPSTSACRGRTCLPA